MVQQEHYGSPNFVPKASPEYLGRAHGTSLGRKGKDRRPWDAMGDSRSFSKKPVDRAANTHVSHRTFKCRQASLRSMQSPLTKDVRTSQRSALDARTAILPLSHTSNNAIGLWPHHACACPRRGICIGTHDHHRTGHGSIDWRIRGRCAGPSL